MNFDEMGLDPKILRAVGRAGYSTATPIQSEAIPLVLAGHDVLGCAQTGTGKTAAFALPTLDFLLSETAPGQRQGRRQRRRPIRVLVLTPTRELANQVRKSFATYGRCTDLRQTMIYGGVSQNPQVAALRAGTDIVIETPGRLLDLMNQGHVRLDAVEVLILDEADQMLDMGFIHDLKRIVKHVPEDRQTLLFSATMPAEIRRLASQWMDRPKMVQATPVASTPEKIKQSVTFVEKPQKLAALVRFVRSGGARHLVFCRTKHGVDHVVRHLERARIQALAIHGNKSQRARENALERFSAPRPPVLVATDVAARGLHMPDISHVINFDLPEVPEIYIHRIGRTARAGAAGESISFCSAAERPYLKRIERLIRRAVKVRKLPAGGPGERPIGERPAPVRQAAARPSGSEPARGAASKRRKPASRRSFKSGRSTPAGAKRRGSSRRR